MSVDDLGKFIDLSSVLDEHGELGAKVVLNGAAASVVLAPEPPAPPPYPVKVIPQTDDEYSTGRLKADVLEEYLKQVEINVPAQEQPVQFAEAFDRFFPILTFNFLENCIYGLMRGVMFNPEYSIVFSWDKEPIDVKFFINPEHPDEGRAILRYNFEKGRERDLEAFTIVFASDELGMGWDPIAIKHSGHNGKLKKVVEEIAATTHTSIAYA